jgi:metallo-beta-lactamase family protein
MNLTFYGASGEVTGSCYLLTTDRARVLIDFGMHQGGREEYQRNFRALPFPAASLDAVLLTHAHIDHCGRMPLLPNMGFRGPIHATEATCDLAVIMLRDAARLQESDTARLNRRREFEGKPPLAPLYTSDDAERVLALFRPLRYGNDVEVAPGIRARYFDAGHMLGSASIELTITEKGKTTVLVMSGDVGHKGTPVLRDPEAPPKADVVVLESTYGDRDHKPMSDTIDQFSEIIKEAIWDKEKVIIPAFAVGRAQHLIYHLHELHHTDRIPTFPVYVDSPMASKAFEVYKKHKNLYDKEALSAGSRGHGVFDLEGLEIIESNEDSRRLNGSFGSGVIIAPSGMCTGGRILHHLKHNLWRKGVHILIVGFQAGNSIGRRLVEGADAVRILGTTVVVRAKIHTLNGFSAHAGRSELLDWSAEVKGASPSGKPPRFILTHGEDTPRQALAAALAPHTPTPPALPIWGQTIEL